MRSGHAFIAIVIVNLIVWTTPGLAISSRTLIAPVGQAAGDGFGVSAASAGDVNGDGYADVIVGAHLNNAGGVDAGRAYVYYGGPGADAVAEVTLTGAAAGDYFGSSVGSAGDWNADGYADLIVGAYGNDSGGDGAGRAYLYFGGPGADAVADVTFTGAFAGDRFGRSVGAAGDVNGDGHTDVIVGADGNGAAGPNAGRAYVYFGGPAGDAVADLSPTGSAGGDFFGISSGTAGDVNGDGYDDFIVGADGHNANTGRAYVYLGGPAPDNVADLTLAGVAPDDYFGSSVGAAGDVNADGYADVVVGAYGNDTGGAGTGRAYVFFGGSPGLDAVADLTLTGSATNPDLGRKVGTAGDVNGDGYADVIVSSRWIDEGGGEAGRAFVYFGGSSPNSSTDLTLTGVAGGDLLGQSVATAGDVNGDGYSDLVVGAYGVNPGGQAYVVAAYPYELLVPNGGEQWVVGEPAVVRWLGANPADIALSTDGGLTYHTVASQVGGAVENEWTLTVPAGATRTAKIRVVYTGQTASRSTSDASEGVFRIVEPAPPRAATTRLQRTLTGEAAGDLLGYSVAGAGDVNGDGYADVIVGAYCNDAGGLTAGRAYVFYGGPEADELADVTLTGAAADDYFGFSVGTAGDVNGDGYSDVVVGAYGNDLGGSSAGSAYIYYGGPGADAVADLEMKGANPNDYFGFSVGTAGDVNGDGYSDVIAGAYGNDAAGAAAGRAYVYYGGPGADGNADLTLTGSAAGDGFGYSVGGAGDMNKDGYDDAIVGASGNDAGGPGAGRAYVFYGGVAADAAADLTLTGAAAGDAFGYSVAAAGDVNGDGYPDVIVGATGNDAGGAGAGRAYVYYGGPAADTVADLTLTGAAAGDVFGYSVATGGDVNGDGYTDVVVGAWSSDEGGPDAGRAYVYYGGPGADAVADITLTGSAAGDNFGNCVGTAGDVNGDGFADLIVGAPYDAAGGVDAGRAYLYDQNRYDLLSPAGGETWNVGATKSISWLGAEKADVWLSTDGGERWELLKTDVGGASSNSVPLQVPHAPTRFAKLKVTPTDAYVAGSDETDSLFTIQTSVSLLAMLAVRPPDGAKGVMISWQTDPGPGDLAGYRLERTSGGGQWRTIVTLTRETSHTDPDGGPGVQYRLFAVNGFGEELWLGEASLRGDRRLAAWPLPYRGGPLTVTFATFGGLGGGPGPADVSVYDVSGRLIRTIARGTYTAGYQTAVWDGRDTSGRKAAAGVYFVRAQSAGQEQALKLAVLQ